MDVASFLRGTTQHTLDDDEANIASGRGAFDVMLTPYSMFERESQRHTWVGLGWAFWVRFLGCFFCAC